MTLGDKLSRLRKENNYTQEQLAGIIGVSRQAISKWESDTAYPETDKLIRISELFDCSLDYLLRDDRETDFMQADSMTQTSQAAQTADKVFSFQEKKSEKTVWGMPLWHIGKNARGVVAVGFKARGIIAVGVRARGLISLGILSFGLLSVGVLPLGLIAIGVLALGFLAVGDFAFGIIAAGAISFGIVSIGAVAVGDFSVGALARGRYAAIGDDARAMIALGKTEAAGTLYQKTGRLTAQEVRQIEELLDEAVPSHLSWAKEILKLFLNKF